MFYIHRHCKCVHLLSRLKHLLSYLKLRSRSRSVAQHCDQLLQSRHLESTTSSLGSQCQKSELYVKLLTHVLCSCRHTSMRRDHNQEQAVVLKHNKPRPVRVLHIAASRGFLELTKNWIRSSHDHSTPSLKIWCKSVQPFSRYLANKETKKERNKEIDRKQYPVPQCIGTG